MFLDLCLPLSWLINTHKQQCKVLHFFGEIKYVDIAGDKITYEILQVPKRVIMYPITFIIKPKAKKKILFYFHIAMLPVLKIHIIRLIYYTLLFFI